MMITLNFEDYREMECFAKKLLGGDSQTTSAQSKLDVNEPVNPTLAPVQSVVPPVQPIAPVQTTTSAVQPTQPVAPPTQPIAPEQPAVAPAPPIAPTVPTSPQSYTIDDLARAAMSLMDAGRQSELQQLLVQFGVEALPSLSQGQYGSFATALRGMGAQI